MTKRLKVAALFAASIVVAALIFTVGPVKHALSQGMQHFTALAGTEQILLNYPCTVSCYITTNDVKTYVNSGGTPGAIVASSVTGSVTPFPINGLNAAQGGSVVVTGGTSSTSADAGGAVDVTGGTPGATGVGGGVVEVGGAGGSTSGAGGAVSYTGGAGTAGNAAGGAATIAGGAGQGSAAGGAVNITGGAGGSTGVGGAVNITAGAPTAGVGSNVVITATAGAASTNGGGSVNLVPGAAVSTGAPGTVQINGNAGLTCGSYYFTGTPAATAQVFFIATRAMLIEQVGAIWSVAAGSTSTLGVYHDTSTNAPGAGTDVLSSDFNLNTTANTYASGSLSATVATLTLAAGDRLSVKFANAIQSTAGLVVTACMAPQ